MADSSHGELAPLLQNEVNLAEQQAEHPPPYSENLQGEAQNAPTIQPLSSDELPPPYTPTPQGGIPMINCKVCQAMINIEGKTHQHVVKCGVCHEATPIKAAPPGKKYVRCQCKCLLICKGISQRIACPRETCKRIINLSPPPTVTIHSPGTSHIRCGHCMETFLFNIRNNSLVRCPHCRKVSAIGASYVRRRALLYTIFGLLFLAAGLGISIGTYGRAKSSKGIYVAWVCTFIIAAVLLIKAMCVCALKISNVQGPV